MKKNDLKYPVAVLLFVTLSSVAAIGLLLGFVVPSGSAAHTEKFFLGLHRHGWGELHLYLALCFLGLLSVHVWLSWSWVVHTTKRYFGESWKKALLVLACSWFLVVLIGWIKLRW